MNALIKLCLLFAALSTFSMQGCAVLYSAKETQAWVVDAETGQPLEGVNVVAHWVLDYATSPIAMHPSHIDWILMETVTDSTGQFRFPAWGPLAVPSELPLTARLAGQDPAVILFKGGYQWQAFSNGVSGPPQFPGPLVRSWGWNGKTIEMKKFNGPLKQYGYGLGGVLTGVNYIDCNWKKIPRMIIALNNEDAELKRQGVYKPSLGVPSLARPTFSVLETDAAMANCGSVADFLKDYQK
jgi:hypothetical protein